MGESFDDKVQKAVARGMIEVKKLGGKGEKQMEAAFASAYMDMFQELFNRIEALEKKKKPKAVKP